MAGDTIAGDITTTATIAAGESVLGTAQFTGDEDWYAIRIGQNERVTLTLEAMSPGFNGALTVHSANGDYLRWARDTGAGEAETLVFTNTGETRDLFVSAQGWVSRGDYRLTVQSETGDGTTDTVGDTPATAGAIAVGETVRGRTDYPTDKDWYAVELVEGEAYRFDLVGHGADELIDPALAVPDAIATLLTPPSTEEKRPWRRSRVSLPVALARFSVSRPPLSTMVWA